MWPDLRLCDLFEIDVPILQAPMAGSSTPELAAAVTNAGGLGAVAHGTSPVTVARALAEAARRLTNGSLNLNFFAHSGQLEDAAATARARARLKDLALELGAVLPEALGPASPGFGKDQLELLLDLRPRVASFHFGLPDAADLLRLKSAGIRIISTATRVSEARWLQEAGCDAIIAQGYEAGGHRGSHTPVRAGDGIGTLALVPQIVDAVSVPVIAAGGIADARGIAAALALGAAGVQIGTAFLRCPEASVTERRRALIAASDGLDTIVTDAVSGRAARTRRSRHAERLADLEGSLPPFPTLYGLTWPLISAAGEARDDEIGFHLYGQAAGLARDMPAGELVTSLARETLALLRRLGGAD